MQNEALTTKPFCGQYLARFEAESKSGFLMLNVDKDQTGSGIAYLSFDTSPLTFMVFDCAVSVTSGILTGRATRSFAREQFHGAEIQQDQIETISHDFQLDTNQTPNRLHYQIDGVAKDLMLHRISHQLRVEAKKIATWPEFKSWVESVRAIDKKAVFRGMPRASFELKTSFHRTGRVNLERYRDEDLPAFRDLADTIGGLKFSESADDRGALWGFAQHHGFPTPLLDWTESPYIAAYFAFSERLQDEHKSDPIRIYMISGKFVVDNTPPSVNMADVFPRVWIFKPKSGGNHRLVFQQGLFLHSNIVNIEAYLVELSNKFGYSIISAIELPLSLAREAIEDLAYMGVSHLSLFPGLDGAAVHAANKQFFRPEPA